MILYIKIIDSLNIIQGMLKEIQSSKYSRSWNLLPKRKLANFYRAILLMILLKISSSFLFEYLTQK